METEPMAAIKRAPQVLRRHSSMAPELPPAFKLLRRLGSGTFSNVFLVLHMPSSQKMALKIAVVGDERMLQREAQLLKSLSPLGPAILTQPQKHSDTQTHQQKLLSFGLNNIIKCIDSPAIDAHCILLEYFPGKEVYDVILDHHRDVHGGVMGVREDSAKYIIHALLCSLFYLEDRGVAHCDLKLENVMVAFEESNSSSSSSDCTFISPSDEIDVHDIPRVKLIDFGFAQHYNDPTVITKGSEPYLPPEAVLRQPSDLFKADIWALGVISFSILTSRMPFDGDADALRNGTSRGIATRTRTMMRRIASGEFSFLPHEAANLSEPCMDVVKKMLTRSQCKRPNAQTLLEHEWFDGIYINESRKGEDLMLSLDGLDLDIQ